MRDKNRYKKTNLIIIATSLVLVAFLSVGYAYLSEQLNISTNVTVRVDKDIRITALSAPTFTNGASEQYNSKYTESTVTNNVNLPNLNSSVSYTVTITNKGTDTMKISSIASDVFSNSNMEYTIEGANVGTIIQSGEETTLTINFHYKDSVTTIPNDISLGSILSFAFETYTYSGTEYVTGNNTLKLEGTTAPVGSSWTDTVNNHSFALTSVNYDTEYDYYSFGTGSSATLGASLIPTTGDFTLEACILTPSTAGSTDQTIVAQVSDASADTGNIKFNINGNTITAVVDGTVVATYSTSLGNGQRYTLQLVRSGGTFKAYLDGVAVGTYTYLSTNSLSDGPLKMSLWTTADNQNYTGSIFALRIYNRSLSTAELVNNYTVDNNKYPSDTSMHTLYTYALNNQVVTTGNGLYNTATDTYLYKGSVTNNYIKFAASTDVYRIIGYYSDGAAKLINTNFSTNLAFDDANNRSASTSTYCASAATSGCNYYGTTTNYNGLTVTTDSTIKIYVDNWYNNLDSSIKSKILLHDFEGGFIVDKSTLADAMTQSQALMYNTHAALISVIDIFNASKSPITRLSTSQNLTDNYLVSLCSATQQIWTLNPSTADTWDQWATAYGTQVARKRASRTSQMNGSTNTLFYVLPSVYISSTIRVSGTGTASDPFVIPN
jgi:hypothetical protein